MDITTDTILATIAQFSHTSEDLERFRSFGINPQEGWASSVQIEEHQATYANGEILEGHLETAKKGMANQFLVDSLVQRALSPWEQDIELRATIIDAIFGSYKNLRREKLQRLLTEVTGPGDAPTNLSKAVQQGLLKTIHDNQMFDMIVMTIVAAARDSKASKLLRTLAVILEPVVHKRSELGWVLAEIRLNGEKEESIFHLLKIALREEAIQFASNRTIRLDSIGWYLACRLRATATTPDTRRTWHCRLLASTSHGGYPVALISKVMTAGPGELLTDIQELGRYDLRTITSFSDIRR